MSDHPSLVRPPSTSTRSYSRPLSTSSSSSASPSASFPTSTPSQSPNKGYSRPRAGGVDFGQPPPPVWGEESIGEGRVMGGALWGPPPLAGGGGRSSSMAKASSSSSRSGGTANSSTTSTSSSATTQPRTSSSSSGTRIPQPSSSLPSSSFSPSSSSFNRLSHPPHQSPRSNPTTPTSRTSTTTTQQQQQQQHPRAGGRRSSPPLSPSSISTGSGHPPHPHHRTPTSSFPPSRTVSLTTPSSPTPTPTTANTSPRTSSRSYGGLSLSSSPYTVYQPQVSIRSASVTRAAAGEEDSSSLKSLENSTTTKKRDSSDEDDLLGQQELRRPSWVSVRIPSLSLPSGRSTSTVTTTPSLRSSTSSSSTNGGGGTPRRRRRSRSRSRSSSNVNVNDGSSVGGGSPLMDELPLSSSHVSVTSTSSSPSPSFTSFASSSSHPDASSSPSSFPSTSLFNNNTAPSSPPTTTTTRTGVRPPPIILPPSSRQQQEAVAAFQPQSHSHSPSHSRSKSQPPPQPSSPVSVSTTSNPSTLLLATSPLISPPPVLPARSPLRPRYESPSPSPSRPSHEGSSPRHHHLRRNDFNRTNSSSSSTSESSFSQVSSSAAAAAAAVGFQDALGGGGEGEGEMEATTRGGGKERPAVGGRRTISSSSVGTNGEASWSLGGKAAGGRREEFRSGSNGVGGGNEVWLDEDQEGRIRDSGSLEKDGKGWTREEGKRRNEMERSRPTSAGSRVGSKTKLKRREARVTSVYMGESSDSNPPSPSLPPPPPLARASPSTTSPVNLPFSGTAPAPQAAFPPSPSLGHCSPSCPAFSTLQEIPNETLLLPSDSITVTQNLTLLALPTIIIPPIPNFSVPPKLSPTSSLSHAHAHARSSSQPLASPSSLNKPLPSPTPSAPTTKRAHLLHEIHSTERSYARDLALVRDAYIQRLRPPPPSSTTTTSTPSGASTVAEPTPPSSSRNSIYTNIEMGGSFIVEESNKSTNGRTAAPLPTTPSPLTPFSPDGLRSPLAFDGSDAASLASTTTTSYFPSYGSSTIPSPRRVFSPGSTSTSTMMGSGGGGGVGALSNADVRAVFLNVEALATLAEEFASMLEKMGSLQEGEEGKDRVGEAFLGMMPRIKQAYTSYCPRQSTAHVRLIELLSNPLYTSYFADSWSLAQPHTKAWDLPSLLIKPVQRVLKYPLLLGDLLKCTPPDHPDFENLGKAAKEMKEVADEINEVKRRKETVDRIIKGGKHGDGSSMSLASSGMSKDSSFSNNNKAKRGVKIGFNRKEKDKFSSSSSSTNTTNTNIPSSSLYYSSSTSAITAAGRIAAAAAASSQFTTDSYEKLRETEEAYARLVARLMSAEMTAKKMGKVVAGWGERGREVWIRQREMVEGWRRLINLGGLEPVEDIRIEAYRVVVQEILEGPCRVMDDELRDSLVPNLLILCNICKGPRTVILKRNSKHEDYNRVVISKNKGDWDRLSGDLIEGAQIFVALHHQLLAELPALLEGFSVILDLVVTALAACQARFHRSVHEKLERFWAEFPPVVMGDGEGVGQGAATSDGAAIIKVWEEAARTPTEMMEALAITRRLNVRVVEPPTLIASGSSTPNPHGIMSRASSTMSIRRSDTASSSGPRTSVASNSNSTSSSSSLPFESTSRSRSSSNARPPVPTPVSPLPLLPTGEAKTGMFHFRTKSKGSKLERHGSQNALAPTPAPPFLPLTARSQTLPPVPSVAHIPIPLRIAPKRNSDPYASSSASSHGPALSALSFEGSDTNPEAFSESVARKLSHPDDHEDHHHHHHHHREGEHAPFNSLDRADRGSGVSNAFSFENRSIHNGNGDGAEGEYEPESPLTPVHPYAASAVTPTKANGNGRGGIIKFDPPPLPPQVQINLSSADDDEEDPDSPAPTLYRCECVADFDLRGLSIKYMGHDFLSIRRGEEIDVVFEIGRVDELDAFPLDVGLEDDGLLIGRDQNGLQGFVLCSFLHPIEVSE